MIQLKNEVKKIMYPSLKRSDEEKFILVFLARRVSMRMSYYIWAKLGVHPNIVTLFSILLGIAGSISFIYQQYLMGGILLFFWMVFDCCDGEVARFTGKTSSLGERLEVLNSNLQYAIWLPSLAIGLYLAEAITLYWVFGAFLGASLYNVFRSVYANYPKDILGEPTSNKMIMIAVHFKNMKELRARYPGRALSYIIRHNILSQGGIFVPAIILLSFLMKNSTILLLSYLANGFTIIYLSFSIITLLGLSTIIIYSSLRA